MYGVSDVQEIRIDEWQVAKQMKTSQALLKEKLIALNEMKICDYTPQFESPTVTFVLARVHPSSLIIPQEKLEKLKIRDRQKWEAIWNYINTTDCRSVWMNRYFGNVSDTCGVCDRCTKASRDLQKLSAVEELFLKEKFQISHLDSLPTAEMRDEAWLRLRLLLDEGIWLEKADGNWIKKKK
jgi:ATP-dependent DNA helicase RecQ